MESQPSAFTASICGTTIAVLICAIGMVPMLWLMETGNEDWYSSYTPSRFSVSTFHDTPAKVLTDSKRTWLSAIIGLVEASYRHQAWITRALAEDAYVAFSEQALNDYATSYFDDDKAMDGASAVQFLGFASGALKSLLPEAACPDNVKCDIKALTEEKLIECEMKAITYKTGVSGMKDLLYRNKRPVVLSMPSIKADFYVPCTDSRVKDTILCVNKELTINETLYGLIRTSTRLPSGQYFAPNDPAVASSVGIDNFLLVGYNDDIHLMGNKGWSAVRASKGAFIVKGFKGQSSGQTISSWLGTQIPSESCIDPNDPFRWIPTETPLTCINGEYCDVSKTYILAGEPDDVLSPLVTEDSYGLTSTRFYVDDELIVIDRVPFWSLGTIFTAKTAWAAGSCGYWTIPYDLLDLAAARGSVVAFGLPLKWSVGSFAPSDHSSDYVNITKSTQTAMIDENRR